MNIFGSPSRYYQGRGILNQMGEILNLLGNRFFILADEIVLSLVRDTITDSMERSGKIPVWEVFRGECSYPEIHRLRSKAGEAGAQVIVGIGGGKAMDTAKALGQRLNLPVVIVPTIAASDAASTHVAVIYDENHAKKEVLSMREGVSFILVDSEMIAQAPARFLSAGMGDALSKKFEAEACWKSGAKNLFGGKPSFIALRMGQLAYDIVREYGEEAKKSVDRKEVSPALEKVIEANLLLSGLVGANGGIAAAHAIQGGLSIIEEMRLSLHGELVAFGVLVQLILENRESDFINDLIRFYRLIGLPATLEELGLSKVNLKEIERAAAKICESGSYVYNMPFKVNEHVVANAILKANCFSKINPAPTASGGRAG